MAYRKYKVHHQGTGNVFRRRGSDGIQDLRTARVRSDQAGGAGVAIQNEITELKAECETASTPRKAQIKDELAHLTKALAPKVKKAVPKPSVAVKKAKRRRSRRSTVPRHPLWFFDLINSGRT